MNFKAVMDADTFLALDAALRKLERNCDNQTLHASRSLPIEEVRQRSGLGDGVRLARKTLNGEDKVYSG